MNVKQLVKLTFSLLLLTGIFLFHPRTASANCSVCLNPTGHTVHCWSKAATCSDAQTNLVPVCAQQAVDDGNCGILGNGYACQTTITSQSACYWNGSQYQIDAYATHGCVYCGQ